MKTKPTQFAGINRRGFGDFRDWEACARFEFSFSDGLCRVRIDGGYQAGRNVTLRVKVRPRKPSQQTSGAGQLSSSAMLGGSGNPPRATEQSRGEVRQGVP